MIWTAIVIAVLGLLVGLYARHRHKKGETKIRVLKDGLREEIKKTCAAAKAGDPVAAQAVEELKESITEQSLRLTGHPKPPTTVIKGGIVAVMFLALGGCVNRNTTTEEDREGVEVVSQITDSQDAELDRIELAVREDPSCFAKVAPQIKAMREKNHDARLVIRQLQENNGKPERPVVYAHAEMPGLLDRMKRSHGVTFWGMIGGAVITGGGIALGIARKFGKFIPGFGPVFAALDTTMTAVEQFMQKKKEQGQVDVVNDLAGLLKAAHADANVGEFIDKKLAKVQEKLNIVTTADLESPTPPASPTA